MQKFTKTILMVLIFAVGSGCNCGKIRKNVDLTGVEADISVRRFDRTMFQLGSDSLAARFRVLNEKYNGFPAFYLTEILGLGDYNKESQVTVEKFSSYLKDPYMLEVRDEVEKTFRDFSPYEKELSQAFAYFKYYFPEKHLPEVITFISNFSYSAITYDTTYLGIGLDMYLGKDYKYYTDLYPQYMYEKFSPEYMTANCMKAIIPLHFHAEPNDNRLLSQMISKGIELYFTDLMMPDADDYRKIGYLPVEIQWCVMNEHEIWKFFVDKELLYSTDLFQNGKYVSPGPAASGMPTEAPGNIGSWLGWQIVRTYVEKYPDVTFEELLEKDPQELLIQSGYKPGKNRV